MSACEITRHVACSRCNGEGDIEHDAHGYSPVDGSLLTRVETCPACDGSGIEEIEMQPIEQDDLDCDDGLSMPAWVHAQMGRVR